MKDKDIWKYSLVFLICMLFAVEVVMYELTGNGLIRKSKAEVTQSKIEGNKTCTDQNVPTRPDAQNDQLKIVSQYDEVCGSDFISEMMIFTNMPVSEEIANTLADEMTVKVKEFEKFNISPVLIIEPDSEWGLIDFNEFSTGLYDQWIDAYFAKLKANGLTSNQLGSIIPFPEPQQEFWNNNKDPDDFAESVNRYIGIARKHFPYIRAGILLDSQVSEDRASKVIAYARLVDPALIDFVGLQGFPWHPSAEGDERRPVLEASDFISADTIIELANSLQAKDVLLNTGTYRHRRLTGGGNLALSTSDRNQILDSIISEIDKLKPREYSITVNIFAENKLETEEGVNWSYWDNKNYSKDNASHAGLFVDFVKNLKDRNVRVGIFDR